jgi:cell division septum initiation protein DivIVA
MENEVAQASARVADIVAAAERAADELYAQAEKRMRERISEGERAAENRVQAAESEALEILANAQEQADRIVREAQARADELRDAARRDAREIVGEASAGARDVLRDGTELSGHLRELSDSLRANAELLLRDVRMAHAEMNARLDQVAPDAGHAERPPALAGDLDVPEFHPGRR